MRCRWCSTERIGSLASYLIGIEPEPLTCGEWPQIERLLHGAAAVSPDPVELLDDGELLWTVRRFEGSPVPVACIVGVLTCRLVSDAVEVGLVGGRDARGWAEPLTQMLCAWARDEGKPVLRAYGRRGWRKVLNWDAVGERDGFVAYERRAQ